MKLEALPWLILFLPLLAAAVITLFTQHDGKLSAGLSIGAVVAGFLLSSIFVGWLGWQPARAETVVNWLKIGDLQVDLGLRFDPLSLLMMLIVTGVAGAIHIYSWAYMSGERGVPRYFACLSLFTFAMLGIVLANNFLELFIFWELVGVSSYLLIGFWFERPLAADAGKKAFITNRLGDFGFLIGIVLVWGVLGSLNFAELQNKLAANSRALGGGATAAGLLVFCGAMGKSAQFPLHVWLPDAMEGPTPVSALIHAATMVNAGVYLVARVNPLFGHAPEAMVVVAGIGIFTAILAASIALTQTDIKRVLAYSTLSQLGYMFAALGVGAWTAAIFHLMTHGFFKGLLFLDSGSVIHAVDGEQDMRRMGGLANKIPITYATMFIGSVAISGIPPLAGFFSKDEILASAFKNGFLWVWLVGFIVAGLTAFYMFRLMGLTFWGKSRVDPEVEPHIHPPSMTIPLILLAIPSVLLGLVIGWPIGAGLLHQWLEPVFHQAIELGGHAEQPVSLFGIDGALLIVSVAVAAIGLAGAWLLFGVEVPGFRRAGRPERVRAITARVPFLYRASVNKWWFD